MNIIRQQFFSLLQAGLWGTATDPTLFSATTDWEEIYRSARAQAVLGVMIDGVQTLPAELRPPRMLYLKWCNALLRIEEKNQLMNHELANLYALCRKHGVEPVLLKGQGVAQNYRNPLHRQCGDIDLFTGTADYDRVNRLLLPEATPTQEECFKHIALAWHGVTIENHRVMTTLNTPAANRRFQADIRRWHTSGNVRRLTIGSCEATLPPLEFDAAYILIHSVLHALNEGVGLRQICDWACLLHHHRASIRLDLVRQMLRSYGLERAARIFGVVAERCLGLPAECLPVPSLPTDLPTAEWLMDDIWQEGNFGQHNAEKKRRPAGYWSGKWYTLTRLTARCMDMRRLSPAEACWYPIIVAQHSLQMQWKRLTQKPR